MKVLHVIDSAGVYGAERMLLSLARQHAATGIVTELASLRTPDATVRPIEAEAARQGMTVHCIVAQRGVDPQAIRRLAALARDRRCDLLHTHSYKANTLVGVARPWRVLPPAVGTLHGWSRQPLFSRIGLYEEVERRALCGLTRVVAVNERMVDDFRLRRRLGKRLVVIRNGVEPVVADSRAATHDGIMPGWMPRTASGFRVLAVGRLDAIKRFDLLIESVWLLRKGGIDASLVILGDGPERNRLEQRIQEKGLAACVHMPGYVADARAWMPHFDALAITSDSEGIPVNMLEAMVEGLPVVARQIGGIPEVIAHRQHGLLAADDSPRGIADLLGQLAKDESLAVRLREAARETVMQRYTVVRMAADYRDVYQTCVREESK